MMQQYRLVADADVSCSQQINNLICALRALKNTSVLHLQTGFKYCYCMKNA